jgi:inorganic pyrophosphatase
VRCSKLGLASVADARISADIAKSAAHIHNAIKEGAQSFLKTEYKAIISFCLPVRPPKLWLVWLPPEARVRAQFSAVIFVLLGSGDAFTWKWKDDPQGVLRSPKVAVGLFSSLAFILGALTSMVCGYLGMMVGTYGNVRTAVEARRGMAPAFSAAYRSGSVMGFLLSSLALLMLFGAVHLYRLYFKDDWASLFAAVAGYGLGGSTVALFGRVGGGVYTKAADVGADLVGKVERGIPEDDPRNPAGMLGS